MPEVYRVRCKQCLSRPSVGIGHVAGYVAMDGRDDGIVIPGGYLAYRCDDGALVCLAHPIEDLTLQEHGGSWSSASRSGRLLSVTYKVCTTCGTINEDARIHDDRQGCMAAIITAITTFVVGLLFFRLHFLLAFALSYGAMFVPIGVASLLYRMRWSKINADLTLVQCASCGAAEFCDLHRATKQPMMCPNCKTKNMNYSSAGIS